MQLSDIHLHLYLKELSIFIRLVQNRLKTYFKRLLVLLFYILTNYVIYRYFCEDLHFPIFCITYNPVHFSKIEDRPVSLGASLWEDGELRQRWAETPPAEKGEEGQPAAGRGGQEGAPDRSWPLGSGRLLAQENRPRQTIPDTERERREQGGQEPHYHPSHSVPEPIRGTKRAFWLTNICLISPL